MYTPSKYKELILLLLQKLGNTIEGKKKLAKLLYFIDFDFFEWKGKSVTNETYYAREMGPLGINLQGILNELKAEKKIRIVKNEKEGYASYVYSLNGAPKTELFSKDEIKMINRVAKKYGLLNGKQLEDLTHNEAPYLGTELNQEIDYELSIYRGTEFNKLDSVSKT